MTGKDYHALNNLAIQLEQCAKQKREDAETRRADGGQVEAACLEGKAAAYEDSSDLLKLALAQLNS